MNHANDHRPHLAWIVCILIGGCSAPNPPASILSKRDGDPSTIRSDSEDPWHPSLDAGFDRSDWPTIRFEISMPAVACNPTYATPVIPPDGEVGRVGENLEFPTIATAMSTTTDRGAVRRSAMADPFVAAFDLVAAPFRMIQACPDSTVLEPVGGWGLLPGPGSAAAPARIEPVPEPPTIEADPVATTPDPGLDTGSIRPAFDRPADAATTPENRE